MVMPMRWMCLLLVLLLAASGHADEGGFLTSKQGKVLERAGLGLARKARVEALEQLLDTARDLRLAPKSVEKLQEKLQEARERSKKPGAVRSEVKALEALAGELAEGLAARDEAGRRHLARCILAIDDGQVDAHQALGHVEQEGRWLPGWLAEAAERRAAVSELKRKARHLEVEVATGVEDLPILRTLYGTKANWADGHGIRVYSTTMSAEQLARTVRFACRGLALSRALLGGALEVKNPRRQRVLLVDSQAKYLEALKEAQANGGQNDDEAAISRQLGAFFDRRGHLTARWLSEAEVEEGTFYYSGREALAGLVGGEPLPCLLVGHLNWVVLRMYGIPLNDATYFDETAHRSRAGRSAAKDPDPVRYERMLRIARAGLHGSRSWLAYRTKMGTAPAWEDAFLDQHGKIRGDERIKCTVINAYLQETGQLADLMRKTRRANARDKAATKKALEDALGMKLTAFEQRFATWLIPPSRGVVQKLGGDPKTAGAKRSPVLAALDEIRRAARPQGKPAELIQVEDLSRNAALHARYLNRHRDLWSQWPDVHGQTPDREGFTPEGHRAGAHSVIAFQIEKPTEAVDQWMGTFYHRLPLLHPGLVGVGWGLEHGIAVLDCQSLVDHFSQGAYVVWPPDGMKGVPTTFQPELPNPVPGEEQSAWGYPITFQYQGVEQQSRLMMSLHKGGGDKGSAVDCWYLTPKEPKNPKLAPDSAWCLIPKAHLKSGATYTVVIDGYRDRGEVKRWYWSFRTR